MKRKETVMVEMQVLVGMITGLNDKINFFMF